MVVNSSTNHRDFHSVNPSCENLKEINKNAVGANSTCADSPKVSSAMDSLSLSVTSPLSSVYPQSHPCSSIISSSISPKTLYTNNIASDTHVNTISTCISPGDVYVEGGRRIHKNMYTSSNNYTCKYHDTLISSSSYSRILLSFNDKRNFSSSLNALIFSLRSIIEEDDEKKPMHLKLNLNKRQYTTNNKNGNDLTKQGNRCNKDNRYTQNNAKNVFTSSPVYTSNKNRCLDFSNSEKIGVETGKISSFSDVENTLKQNYLSAPPSPDYSSEHTSKSDDGDMRKEDRKEEVDSMGEYLLPPAIASSVTHNSNISTSNLYVHQLQNRKHINSNDNASNMKSNIVYNNSRLIVVSFDMSARCKREMEWLKRNILKQNDTVILVHVAQELLSLEQTSNLKSPGMILVTKKELTEHNENQFEKIKRKMRNAYDNFLFDFDVYPVIVPLCKNSKGSIGSIICTFGRELFSDLLCVGFRSKHFDAVRHFFFGSISKYVFDHAQCPVLIVKV